MNRIFSAKTPPRKNASSAPDSAIGPALTASDREFAAAILSDYPCAGLESIQQPATRAEVCAPSIPRFVAKIGLSRYQDFQRRLIAELKEGERSPVEVHGTVRAIDGGYLGDFIARAKAQMAVSGEAITENQFECVCAPLGDTRHDVYMRGGRATDTIADYLSVHLRQARRGVFHLPGDTETWPKHLLRMRPGDALFLIDVRRYRSSLERLAETAQAERGARVVLMTDTWISPIARQVAEVMPVGIASRTLWGSYTPTLAVAKAVATRIGEAGWDQTKARIEAWNSVRITERKGTS